MEVDERGERMNAKIRDAQKQKVPYMLVIGDKEMETGLWHCACAPAKPRPDDAEFIERARMIWRRV